MVGIAEEVGVDPGKVALVAFGQFPQLFPHVKELALLHA
jgi:hypothetical protein